MSKFKIFLALTIYDKIIIAKIRDPQTYWYNDGLIELTILDLDSKVMSYEKSIYDIWNNMITSALL